MPDTPDILRLIVLFLRHTLFRSRRRYAPRYATQMLRLIAADMLLIVSCYAIR